MTVHNDNELKRLLNNPIRHVSECSMAPPLTVSIGILCFLTDIHISIRWHVWHISEYLQGEKKILYFLKILDQRSETTDFAKCTKYSKYAKYTKYTTIVYDSCATTAYSKRKYRALFTVSELFYNFIVFFYKKGIEFYLLSFFLCWFNYLQKCGIYGEFRYRIKAQFYQYKNEKFGIQSGKIYRIDHENKKS